MHFYNHKANCDKKTVTVGLKIISFRGNEIIRILNLIFYRIIGEHINPCFKLKLDLEILRII